MRGAPIEWSGRFRVYFNHHGTSGLVAAIDDGTQSGEHDVREIQFHGVHCVSVYHGKRAYPEPSFVFEGFGRCLVVNDVAHVYPLPGVARRCSDL